MSWLDNLISWLSPARGIQRMLAKQTLEELQKNYDAGSFGRVNNAWNVFNDSGDSIYIMDQISDVSSTDEAWVEDIALRDAMKKLGEREKRIIDMRYFQSKTQSEIAKEIGISQAQVSRLEKSALERIRKSFY